MPGVSPVLMRREEVISLKEAMDISGKSEVTIRRMCKKLGLARQTKPHAPLEISRVALEMALHGDKFALDLLRCGDRLAPEVERYLRFIGLPASQS